MKKINKAIVLVMVFTLVFCLLSGCSAQQDTEHDHSHEHSHDHSSAIPQSKNSTYLVNDNSTEELLQYSVTYKLENGESIIVTFGPDGTLWYTTEHGKTVYTDAYTDEVKTELDKKTAIMNLVGTESDDLIYKRIFDNSGTVVGERYSSKSKQYPEIRLVYETIK